VFGRCFRLVVAVLGSELCIRVCAFVCQMQIHCTKLRLLSIILLFGTTHNCMGLSSLYG